MYMSHITQLVHRVVAVHSETQTTQIDTVWYIQYVKVLPTELQQYAY